MEVREVKRCFLVNSIEFAIFFPFVTALYFLLTPRFRWQLLLAASCIFYMFFVPKYILILALTIMVDYFAAIYIESHTGRVRKLALVFSILVTCLILAVFKYYNFFLSNIDASSQFFGLGYHPRYLNIILPIGLSFHTFQSLSYVIEVYQGNQKAERHFGIYALYVIFFPQLVAGPIERPQHLLFQFRRVHRFDYDRVRDGLLQIIWGLIKKVVIADRLSEVVNQVYAAPQSYAGVALCIATAFFAFQIYCDFSGYSDIALGTAQMLGFKLMTNFRRPYFAASVAEFWQRWHISLSTWFKDYVYIPLGGNRCCKHRWYFNLFITFLISGFWHGANWTYVAWGALNGAFLIAESQKLLPTQVIGSTLLKRMVTFVLISLTWVFFRANTVQTAFYILTHMASFSGTKWPAKPHMVLGCALSILGLLLVERYQERGTRFIQRILDSPQYLRWTVYYLATSLLYLFGIYGRNQFIYFQF